MKAIEISLVIEDSQKKQIADLANLIWHEYFTPIIGQAQVDYMLEKFQSYEPIKQQIATGYEYYAITDLGKLIGYTAIKNEEKKLFLSKLYLKKEYRGKKIAKTAIEFLNNLAKDRSLSKIYLTVNKHNDSTIAAYEKMKFNKVDAVATDIGNGFVMDDYIMERNVE